MPCAIQTSRPVPDVPIRTGSRAWAVGIAASMVAMISAPNVRYGMTVDGHAGRTGRQCFVVTPASPHFCVREACGHSVKYSFSQGS